MAREAGAEECHAALDGVGVRYLRAGSGPPLLLLHGLMGYSFSWRKNMAALGREATVLAPDLPGVGYSSRGDYDCSFAGTARLLARMLDQLGINRADVLGTSHGGAVAIMLAAMGRARRLILVAPVNPYSRAGRKRVAVFSSRIGTFLLLRAAPMLQRTHGFFLQRMYGQARVTPEAVAGYAAPITIPGTLPHIAAILRTWKADLPQLKEAAGKIADLPTLLIWGDRDLAVPIASAEPLRRHFRHAQLVVLKGAGHLPYEEVPEEFNRALLEWLARSAPADTVSPAR